MVHFYFDSSTLFSLTEQKENLLSMTSKRKINEVLNAMGNLYNFYLLFAYYFSFEYSYFLQKLFVFSCPICNIVPHSL